MRADRLISLMMLLQTKGKMTAAQLAAELTVSKRTIYRDIDALSGAGVPVYADGGPGGGYALLDSYRTTLTGLKPEEMQALFMLTIPGPITDLGMSQQLKSTILKLTTALPDRYQAQATLVQQRLHLDTAGWFQQAEAVPYLQTIQEAVWQDRQIRLKYRQELRTISPYGLVAKAGIWYVVADTAKGMRVFRVSRIEAVDLTQTTFTRPADFDLTAYWKQWSADYQRNLPQYPVTLHIGPDLAPILPTILGQRVKPLLDEAEPDADGWRTIVHIFERMEEARAYILGMGSLVEVIAPDALRQSIIEMATDIVDFYAEATKT